MIGRQQISASHDADLNEDDDDDDEDDEDEETGELYDGDNDVIIIDRTTINEEDENSCLSKTNEDFQISQTETEYSESQSEQAAAFDADYQNTLTLTQPAEQASLPPVLPLTLELGKAVTAEPPLFEPITIKTDYSVSIDSQQSPT